MKKVLAGLALVATVIIGFIVFSVSSDEAGDWEHANKDLTQQVSPDQLLADATVDVASEETSNKDIHINRKEYQGEDYHISLSYPVFDSDKLNKDIEAYNERVIDDFLLTKEDNDLEGEDTHYLTVSFDIDEIGQHVYSIIFEVYSEIVPSSPYTQSNIFMVDTNDNSFVDQDRVFKEDSLADLNQVVADKLEAEYPDYFFQEEFDQIADNPGLFNFIHFAGDQMLVSFSQYTVAAGAAGAPSVKIPLEEVEDYFTDDWVETLNSSAESTSLVSREEVDKAIKEAEENAEGDLEDEPDDEKDVDDKVEKQQVALTFDDGPHASNTEKILKLLDDYDAKATFFMLGNAVEFYPEIVEKVHEAGHEIGNHSWNHPDMVTLSDEQANFEIHSTDLAIEKITGEKPTLFRPPYGSTNDRIQGLANRPSILWDVDTLDWKNRNPQAILNNVVNQTHNDSIILMHDIHDTTVEGLALTLEYLSKEGYDFVTVSELEGY